MTVRLMSDGELTRLEVLRDLDRRRLTTAAATQLLGLERRQVFRLLKAYRSEGPAGLISKRRGRSSNRRKPEAVRSKALSIIREHYWDFGPTLAAEKGPERNLRYRTGLVLVEQNRRFDRYIARQALVLLSEIGRFRRQISHPSANCDCPRVRTRGRH